MAFRTFENIATVIQERNYIAEKVVPSYLSTFSLTDIILIHKTQVASNVYKEDRHIDLSTDSSESNDLDLTGTPLECPFGLDNGDIDTLFIDSGIQRQLWREEENYTPLPIQDARYLLNMYLSSCEEKDPLKESVWVVCDGNDFQHTIFLGSQIDCGWILRGSICLKDDDRLDNMQKKGDKIKSGHVMLSMIPEEKMISKMMVVFDIFGVPRGNENNYCSTRNELYESVSLEIVWRNSLLQRNLVTPPPEAITTMVIEAPVGKEQSTLYPLWVHLLYLKQLVDILSSGHETFPQSTLSKPNTLERVQEFINSNIGNRYHYGIQQPDYQMASDNLIETLTNVAQTGSAHHDFTHKLWPLIICCENMNEVIQCLELVFEAVKSGAIRPYIHRQNKTFVARTIDDLRNGSQSWPDILSAKPLGMLLEIGLDALKRDYTYMFISLDLASMDQLHNSNQELDTDDTLAWFGQMHCVFEMLLVTQIHLNLPSSSLYPIVTSAINTFREKYPTFEDLQQNRQIYFRHHVKTADIRNNITKDFCSWQLQLKSESLLKKVTTVCHCSTRSILPPLLFKPDFRGENDNCSRYYCSVLTIVGDKIE